MDYGFVIGIAAGICTTVSFIPQVIKTHRTKHTRDFSLWMLILLCGGISLWVVYGFILGELPVIVANLVTLVLSGYILTMKLRHG